MNEEEAQEELQGGDNTSLIKLLPLDVWYEICLHLIFEELVQLYSTCKYLHNGDILKKCFDWYLDDFPESEGEEGASYTERVRLRIGSLVSLAGTVKLNIFKKGADLRERSKKLEKDNKAINKSKKYIREWLLIDEMCFDNGGRLLLEKKALIYPRLLKDDFTKMMVLQFFPEKGGLPFKKGLSVDLYQLLSFIGARRRLSYLGKSMPNMDVELGQLKADNYRVFYLAVLHNSIGILELLCKLASSDEGSREKLLTFNENEAFFCAAITNRVDVVNVLLDVARKDAKMGERLSAEIRTELFELVVSKGCVEVADVLVNFVGIDLVTDNDCHIFKLSVLSGCAAMVSFLYECVGNAPDLKQHLLTMDKCYAFCAAACHGYAEIIALLWEFAGDYKNLQHKLLQENESCAFRWAAECGHDKIVELFLAFACDDETVKHGLLNACEYEAFRLAYKHEHYDVVKLLLGFGEKVSGELLTARDCEVFILSCRKRHVDMVNLFLAVICDDTKSKLLTALDCEAFGFACINNHDNIVKLLLSSVCDDAELTWKLLIERKCCAFRSACKNGYANVVNLLLIAAGDIPGLKRELLTALECEAFRSACKNGYANVVNLLLIAAGDIPGLKRELLTAKACEVFYLACSNKNVNVLKELFVSIVDDACLKREILTAKKYEIFCSAVGRGSVAVVNLCLTSADFDSGLVRELLTARKYRVFLLAAARGAIDVVKCFVGFAGNDRELKSRWLKMCNESDICSGVRQMVVASIATDDLIECVRQYRYLSKTGYIIECIKKGADVNACDATGKYILELAILAGNFEIAKFLLDREAKITIENVIPIFCALNNSEEHNALIEKIFKIISAGELVCKREEALLCAPKLAQRYHKLIDDSCNERGQGDSSSFSPSHSR